MVNHDEIVWEAINHYNCSFRIKTKTQNLCKNPLNVTGCCNRSSCPLANSHYATTIEKEGHCYLFIKTIERIHMPNRLWHKIRLNSNYSKALDQIDRHLEFWPKFFVHRAKQRLTKIMQYVTRAHKLKENSKSNLIINHQKLKRDNKRENKAKIAAHCERTIETDIISRLNSGIYGDIYSISPLETDILDNSSSHVAHSLACVTSDNERSYKNEYDEPEAYLEDLEDTYPTATLEDPVENKIYSGT